MSNVKVGLSPAQDIEVSQKLVISQNYERLSNKPKINGIELTGNKSSNQLNILSNDMSQYEVLSVLTDDSYVLVTKEGGDTKKYPLKQATTGRITGTDVASAEVGNFIIKSITED